LYSSRVSLSFDVGRYVRSHLLWVVSTFQRSDFLHELHPLHGKTVSTWMYLLNYDLP
jgi:hypothetical protein